MDTHGWNPLYIIIIFCSCLAPPPTELIDIEIGSVSITGFAVSVVRERLLVARWVTPWVRFGMGTLGLRAPP
jgi:hypothetical protein